MYPNRGALTSLRSTVDKVWSEHMDGVVVVSKYKSIQLPFVELVSSTYGFESWLLLLQVFDASQIEKQIRITDSFLFECLTLRLKSFLQNVSVRHGSTA